MAPVNAVAINNEPCAMEVSKPASAPYNVSVGYLRAFITLLVLAHHSVLAYIPYVPGAPTSLTGEQRWWEASPVMDAQRWRGWGLLVSFNDMFFMALMFFLSGLFVWKSLVKKGAGQFLRDRALRLGVPFLVAAAVVAPVAYYPAYLQTGAGRGIAGFWQQWKALGNWPAGPAWFVWVLLAFDAIAAGLLLIAPRWGSVLSRGAAGADRRPVVFFGLTVAVSALAYIPLELLFNAARWSSFGPFFFQTSRGLHYLAYFLLGAGVGVHGLNRGLLARDGKLARRWWAWAIGAPVTFALSTGIGSEAAIRHAGSRGWEITGDIAWVISCAASSFAFMALFARCARMPKKMWDSLSANAYGMYLIHYAFVGWVQYALLPQAWPAVVKGSVVFVSVVLLSWGATAGLRRIPAVARVM